MRNPRGFFGLSVGPKLIGASLVPHVLFAGVLWVLCLWAFHEPASGHGAPSHGFG
jgi:hypothetical protein